MSSLWRWRNPDPGWFGAFTDVRAGNLALHVNDDPAVVMQHRAAVQQAAGAADVVYLDQVHSATVVTIDSPASVAPTADAAVTTTRGLFLAVMVADCVPVILADPAAGVVAVAHAGRRGMEQNIAAATVAAMQDVGASDIHAVLGPCVCARCYEVPQALRQQVGQAVPHSSSITATGTPSLDLAAGVAGQLVRSGVRAQILPGCTAQDDSLFSYRRDSRTGRFIGLVGLS